MSGTTNQTVSTRFIIISDTHDFQFDGRDAIRFPGPFQQPVPKADVLLHCGDLTGFGRLETYMNALEMLGSIDAELKLVIAGNHDRSLDGEFWKNNVCDRVDRRKFDEDFQVHVQAKEIMKGPLAADAGVLYLEEGLHEFTLRSGARFTVYASAYTPEFCGWAFAYERDQDRFNGRNQVSEGITSISENPIPDFPGVDIMMTHGPPKDILDWTISGNVGCDNLLRAVSRARPRMHCFGHIHEGHGATLVEWKSKRNSLEPGHILKETRHPNRYPEPQNFLIDSGKETLMVNAAIRNVHYHPVNAPWLVDLDLPLVTKENVPDIA